MDVTRRSFLRAGSLMSLAAALTGRLSSIAFGQYDDSQQLGTGLGNLIPKEAFSDPLYGITRVMFTENIKTKFSFSLGGVRLGYFVLIEVNDLNPDFVKNDGTGSRDCYSLVFRGPNGLPLNQGTYKVQHGKLGKFQLFVVPGDASRLSGPHYEAIINRV
jgi:hypothetical protein